jgi:hypothetical protein
MPPVDRNCDQSKIKLKLLAYCNPISTRVMMEISLSPYEYVLEFCDGERNFIEAVTKQTHDVYFIDATVGEGDAKLRFFKEVTSVKFKGLRRIILIVDRPMPAEADQMRPFGPLCFLECFFTRARMEQALKRVMELKDTGVRVADDPNYFDINKLKKQ